MRKQTVRWTRPVTSRFLKSLGAHGNVSLAAKAADVDRTSVYKRMRADDAFRREVERVRDACRRRREKWG